MQHPAAGGIYNKNHYENQRHCVFMVKMVKAVHFEYLSPPLFFGVVLNVPRRKCSICAHIWPTSIHLPN